MKGAEARRPVIAVVGPCGSGKSTLVSGLIAHGYACRHVAQEHSYVPYMWQRITDPDILIYLGASYETCTRRRKLNWSESDYAEQLRRLSHAREHAHLTIETDSASVSDVLDLAIKFLEGRKYASAPSSGA